MGSLADLVGAVIDLTPPYEPEPGTVLLTLRHGKPTGVIGTGRKLRRGKGLPLTMSPRVIPISTQDVPIGASVKDIAVQGPYPLPEVELKVVVRINNDKDYEGLCNYVQAKGLNFAELLDGELIGELDRRVRRSLSGHDHKTLLDGGDLASLLDLETPLLGGLFKIEGLQYLTPTWHPEFIRQREAVATAASDAVEMQLELGHSAHKRALAAAHDDLLAEEAERRDLTIAQHENPELVQLDMQHAHEEKIAALNNADALRRAGGAELLQQALNLGEGAPKNAIRRIEVLTEATVEEDEPLPDILRSLRREPGLLRVWRAAEIGTEPLGIALDEDSEKVIAVCAEELHSTSIQALEEVFRERLEASGVHCLAGVSTLEELIRLALYDCVPEIRNAAPQITLRAGDRHLSVWLSSDRQRMRPFVHQLEDERLLSPLSAVLPYDEIEVQTQSAA